MKNNQYAKDKHWKVSKAGCENIALAKIGEKNPNWKGGKSFEGRVGIHKWIKERLPKPEFCQSCGKVPPYDLANISPKYDGATYTRDIKNWNWLCRSCHMKKDGRVANLHRANKASLTGRSFPNPLAVRKPIFKVKK